jgi:putative flippase GtrA
MNFLKKINKFKFFTFCFVGLGAFLIDFLFFNLFYRLTNQFIPSRVFSIILSMFFNFFTNRKITFSAEKQNVKKQIVKWLGVYGFSSIINILVGKGVLWIMQESVLSANIAFFVGLCFSIPINYLLSLKFVFKK